MSYQSKHTGAAIDASVDTTQQILNMIYPVGSIYMSVNNVSPATFIGGTWTALTDRVLIGAGSSYTVNATGGATTHTHTSAAHTHTTAGHTLTVSEIPSHRHTPSNYDTAGSETGHKRQFTTNLSTGSDSVGRRTHATGSAGYVMSAKNSDDITSVAYTSYVGGGGSHNHGNTGSTTPGNTGSSSNLPPYLAVYMWKRTA